MDFPEGFTEKTREYFPKDEKLSNALKRKDVEMVKFLLSQHSKWPDAVDDVLKSFKNR